MTDNPRKTLASFGIAVIPPIFGIAIPGGLVAQSVAPDPPSIFWATLPWTLSIAIATLFYSTGSPFRSDAITFGGIGAILALGGYLGLALSPKYVVASSQAARPLYYLLVRNPQAVPTLHVAAHHAPMGAAALFLGIIVCLTCLTYGLLYGWALWLAGIVCGVWLGRLVTNAISHQ
jgi:hypothetical protein